MNALFLLLGLGVTALIVAARQSKAAPGGPIPFIIKPAAGETWMIAIEIDPPDFTAADRAALVKLYEGTADVISVGFVTADQKTLGLILKYKRSDSAFPAPGTVIPWGRGKATFLGAERY